MQATGANYGGSGPPPGSPLWTIYAWVFIRVLQFSNIAWRVAVSSVVAGALTCGTLALIVSRGSVLLLERTKSFKRLAESDESQLRAVCGVVAGLGFGFNRKFWNLALIVAPDALGMLMISVVFCLLLHWAFRPRQIGYLYAAAFIYGLSLTVQISLAALAPALPFLVLFLRPALGRDLLALTALILGLAVVCFRLGWLPEIFDNAGQFSSLWRVYRNIAILYAIVAIWLVIWSRRLFTKGVAALIISALCVSGLSLYSYLPITSMTNPPANWRYARTVEGFYHMISRGQFERTNLINPLVEPTRYLEMLWQYSRETWRAVGWVYLLPCLLPLIFLHRVQGRQRPWLMGLAVCIIALSLFTLAMLNLPPDRQAWEMAILYFFSLVHAAGDLGRIWIGSPGLNNWTMENLYSGPVLAY